MAELLERAVLALVTEPFDLTEPFDFAEPFDVAEPFDFAEPFDVAAPFDPFDLGPDTRSIA